MNKWKIDILLNNKTRIKGIYWGEEKNSSDVANFLLAESGTFFGIKDRTNTKMLVVKIEEVAYMHIYL